MIDFLIGLAITIPAAALTSYVSFKVGWYFSYTRPMRALSRRALYGIVTVTRECMDDAADPSLLLQLKAREAAELRERLGHPLDFEVYGDIV